MCNNAIKRLVAAIAVLCVLAGITACAKSETEQNIPAQTQAQSAIPSQQTNTAEAESTSETHAQTNYDRTAQYGATALSDGDSLVGGTYTATGDDESVLEASGTVKATVTGAALNKTAGKASGADDASFTGLNAAIRVYGDA